MPESGRGTGMSRALVVAAGLFGAAGVGAAAAASHVTAASHLVTAGHGMAAGQPGNELLRTAALFLMLHAAALVAVAGIAWRAAEPWPAATARPTVAAWPGRVFGLIGLAIAAGVLLFAGDLASRALLGGRLFPGAAPIGGSLLIASWLSLALAGLLAGRSGG